MLSKSLKNIENLGEGRDVSPRIDLQHDPVIGIALFHSILFFLYVYLKCCVNKFGILFYL